MASLSWASSRAIELINEFKERGLIEKEWSFAWNKRKCALGVCNYKYKIIFLSTEHVIYGTEAEIEDTIRHELAHILAGNKAGHGPEWIKACKITGAKPKRCAENNLNIPSRYVGTCPSCNGKHNAHRRSKRMDTLVCKIPGCNAKKEKKYIIWKENIYV